MAGGFTSQATGFTSSTWHHGPHRAEAFPAAVRELLQHHEHRTTNMLRLASRRVDKRARVGTPLDGPATVQKSEVLCFGNVAQHLETLVSGLSFVALPDGLLADFRRCARAEADRVIGPIIRQRNRISRDRRGNVLLTDPSRSRPGPQRGRFGWQPTRPVPEALALQTRPTRRQQRQLNAPS